MFVNLFERVDRLNHFFYIFIGGRGVGKTYSALRESVKRNYRFMYVRRTQTEIENCCNDLGNPFKKLNKDFNWNVTVKPVKDIIGIYNDDMELIGYSSALSTFGKLRGVDFEDVEYIIFDEFINISNINTLKNEFFTLCNMIETINRNREMLGQESIKVILISNANTINDDIIRALRLGEVVKDLTQNGGGVYEDDERGLYLELLESIPEFKDKKESTRLYQLTKGTTFHDMALSNSFTNDYFDDVKRLDYKELIPITWLGDYYIYRHKTRRMIYITLRRAKVKGFETRELEGFKRHYGLYIKNSIEQGLIVYQNYDVKLGFLNSFY